jgi:membrane complex biogenesis BtpA family protein
VKLPKLIGVIRLPALAGSPKASHQHPVETLQNAGMVAVREAQALVDGGCDGVLIENFGDTPYFPNQVPPETVASLAIIAAAVRETVEVPLGISVLRNDARSALAVAAITGCDFIRVNVLAGVVATDQGLLEGDAAYLLRERARLNTSIGILADVHVKHGVTLSNLDIGHAIEEIAHRALADGVVVTGRSIGRLPDIGALQVASDTAKGCQIPLYVGSGITAESAPEILPLADGLIVGSAFRKNGIVDAALDSKRIREFTRILSQISRGKKKSKLRSKKK